MYNPTTQIRIRLSDTILARFAGLSSAGRSEAIGLILRAVFEGVDPVQIQQARPVMERLLVRLENKQEPMSGDIKFLIGLLHSKTDLL